METDTRVLNFENDGHIRLQSYDDASCTEQTWENFDLQEYCDGWYSYDIHGECESDIELFEVQYNEQGCVGGISSVNKVSKLPMKNKGIEFRFSYIHFYRRSVGFRSYRYQSFRRRR